LQLLAETPVQARLEHVPDDAGDHRLIALLVVNEGRRVA
jgi:hypothetical protein